MKTGWLGEEPDQVPAMPVTQMMLARQQHRAGPLATALARSRADDARAAREAAASAPDPDDRAASIVARGYQPGLLRSLSERLGDTVAELEAERDKIEKAARRAQFAAREHAAGRADMSRMLAMMDGDEGDESRVAMLERRVQSLQQQIGEAQDMIAAPQQRESDPVAAAVRAAHQLFRETTRAAWEAAQAGTARPARRERRPFESVSRSGGTEQHTGPDCRVCAAAREQERARALEDAAAVYGPGEVITTGYQQAMAYR